MTLKEFLLLLQKKLSIRIFFTSFLFILFISSIFYFVSKSFLIKYSISTLSCTSSERSNILSTELDRQKNMTLVASSIIHPIISKSIEDSKQKNLETVISREIQPLLKNYTPDIFFIRFLKINKTPYDFITFTKQGNSWLKEKGSTKNKKILTGSDWWQNSFSYGEYFGSYFPDKNSLVYSKLISYNGIPVAIIGTVIKKDSITKSLFKSKEYSSLNFYLLNRDFFPIYISSDANNIPLTIIKNQTQNNPNKSFYTLSDSIFIINNFNETMKLVTSIEKEELFENIFILKLLIFAFIIISSVFSLVTAVYIEKRLSKPLSRLLKSLKSSSKGNLSANISPLSKGTMGEIEKGVNQLVSSIKNFNSELIISKTHAEYTAFSKTQFISNISREIRSPLNGIASAIDILKSSSLTDYQKKYLSVMEISTNSIIDTFNEIVEFLRIESGTSVVKISELNLKDIILSITSSYYFTAEKKGVSFSNYIDKSIPSLLYGDGKKLSIVLSNLIDNALKFTERGSISVSAINTDDFPEFCSITFSISDTGKGLSDQEYKNIFTNFSSGDILNKYNQGLGIGLSIVIHNLRLMGSSLEFSSTENGGSKFFFTLSFKKVISKNNDIQNMLNVNSSGNSNILIVDDSPANLDIIETFLKDEPITIFKAYSGTEAISTLDETAIDLILLDLQMPDMSGFQVSKIIREREKFAGRRIPIIAMTAYMLNDDYNECLINGIDDCLIKPFNSIEISDIIQKWIK